VHERWAARSLGGGWMPALPAGLHGALGSNRENGNSHDLHRVTASSFVSVVFDIHSEIVNIHIRSELMYVLYQADKIASRLSLHEMKEATSCDDEMRDSCHATNIAFDYWPSIRCSDDKKTCHWQVIRILRIHNSYRHHIDC
jgi:hypothetical protein